MLIESSDQGFLDYLNEVLLRYGIQSHVVVCGSNNNGIPLYAIDVLSVYQDVAARNLLVYDYQFLNDVGVMDYKNQLLLYRTNSLIETGNILSSARMKKFSLMALCALIVVGVVQWLSN